ncbi:MAG: hemolysin family protein [Acidobacteria bacterium]|nr:hemolysin family protein [Acidobacteriota bacterium]
MLPLLLFLLGCGVTYVATIESAFGAMVRLPDRLSVERDVSHESLRGYLEDPLRLYVGTRLLRGLLFASAAATLARLIGVATPQAVGLLLLALVVFVLVCEQLVPSVIVRRDAGRVLAALLPSFDRAMRILGPVTVGLSRLAHAPRLENGDGEPAQISDGSNQEPTTEGTEERKLLQSVVDFGGTLVREVMTPRPDIVAIDAGGTVAEFRALFAEEEYSRIPVFKENLDHILGFVFAKDLVTLDVPGSAKIVPRLLRPAYVVPDSKRVADLLRELQGAQVQSAIVVDEYGGTAGLVTIEDLLEEIVGEIRDEYDGNESEPIVDEGDGAFLFLATVSVGDMVDRLGIAVERDGFETVGGYLLTRLGRVPAVGETVEVDELTVEVLEAERRRVRKVRVRPRGRPDAVSN